ncbi:MAG: mandelate racemase/muconate lactonizing enzyme family protein [Pseudomonadota bacterium]
MKITDVCTFIVDAHRTNWVIVKIETDAGIYGLGEATVERRERASAEAVKSIGNYLIGQDPFPVEHHARTIIRDSYWRTGVVNRSALSGIEAALWDIKGKALDVPVYELLGGKCRDRIRAYANNWAPVQAIPGADTMETAIAKPLEMGFGAVKWDPFGQAWMHMDRAARATALEQIKRARAAGGDGIELLIEGHGRLDVPTAVTVGNAIAEWDPLLFEEPIPPDSLEALAEVKSRIPVPVAGGERYMDKARFMEVAEKKALDWWQPDVCHVGGLAEMKAIASIADTRFLPVAPHNPMGPVGNAMTLQLAAVIPNFTYLETMMIDVPWRGEVVQETCVLEAGEMIIPDAPGLGIELDEHAAARHEYVFKPPGHFRKREPWPEGSGPWFNVKH